MRKGLFLILAVLGIVFLALLPSNLRKLQQARRDTQEADELARRAAAAQQTKKATSGQAARLDENQNRAAHAPKDPDAHFAYGDSLYAAGRPLDAAAEYQEAARLAPNRPEPHAQLARCYLDMDYTDLAIEELRNQIKLQPSDTVPVLLLVRTLGKLGKLNECQEVLARASALHPHSKDLSGATAMVLLAAGNFAGAQQAALTACQLAPGDPKAWSTLATVYQHRAMNSEAETALRRALAADPSNLDYRVVLAQLFMDRPEKRAEGRRILEDVIAQQPQHVGARYTLAQLLMKDHQYDAASQHLRVLRQREPKFRGALHLLGQAEMKAGRTGQARALMTEDSKLNAEESTLGTLQMAVSLRPSDYDRRIQLAALYIGRGKFGQAIYELKSIPSTHPSMPRVRELMGQAYLRSGRIVELDELRTGKKRPGARVLLAGSADAATALTRSIVEQRTRVSQEPNNAEAWLRLGAALGRSGDLGQSLHALQRAAELAPSNPLAWRALAHANKLAGRRAEQIAAISRWIEAAPNDPEAYEQQAAALLAAGWVPDAVTTAQRAVQLNPQSSAAHKLLGKALHYQGDKEASQRELKRARELNPDDFEIDLDMALNHLLAGEYPSARAILDSILTRRPNDLTATLQRGSCNANDPGGDQAAAERDFKTVISANPGSAVAHYNLGALYNRQKRLQDAAAELERSVSLSPSYVDAMRLLARVYSLQGKRDEARRLITHYKPLEALDQEQHRLQNRMTQSPNDPSVRLALGRFYKRVGRVEDAIAEFQRGLDLAPHSAELKAALDESKSHRPSR